MRQIKALTNKKIIFELKGFPNQGILWEIIEGKVTGDLFELSDDVVVIIERHEEPFVFIAGEVSKEIFSKICELLKKYKNPMIHCSNKYHGMFLEQGLDFYFRVNLSLKSDQRLVDIQDENIIISKIDSTEAFRQCTWYKERKYIYGSDENFLENGLGYALFTKDKKLVSEAFASIGSGVAEIGVITHPNFRNMGYAVKVVSFLIRKCLSKSITPQWSCNAYNKGSLKTALKLGFQISSYSTLLVVKNPNI